VAFTRTTLISDPEENRVETVVAVRLKEPVRTGHRPSQVAPAAEATDLLQQPIRVVVAAQEQAQMVRRDPPPREAMGAPGCRRPFWDSRWTSVAVVVAASAPAAMVVRAGQVVEGLGEQALLVRRG
jgi:hypothetical protein